MKPISYNTFIDKHYYNAWIVNEYDNTVALWPKNSPCEREMDKAVYLDYVGRLYNTKFETISEYRKNEIIKNIQIYWKSALENVK